MHSNSITEISSKQIDKINRVYQRHLPYLDASYHKQACIIKDYYAAIVYERMKNYKEAIRLYKESFEADSLKQIIKSMLRVILIKFKQV